MFSDMGRIKNHQNEARQIQFLEDLETALTLQLYTEYPLNISIR